VTSSSRWPPSSRHQSMVTARDAKRSRDG
jgi:hypothetical protein